MGISVKELRELDRNACQIIDIRSETEIAHGAIEGAVAMCKMIQISPSHSGAQITGGFLYMVHGVKNVRLKNSDRYVQTLRIFLNNPAVFRAVSRIHGCNKIALGHHYDDVIETILMGMLYGAQIQTMMPKLRSTNFEGMHFTISMESLPPDIQTAIRSPGITSS